jgi:hypothetical protein
MPEFINTADAIGDDEMCDQIIMRTVTEYKENRISKIGKGAFYACTALIVVDTPNVTSIAEKSMMNCSALVTLILRNSEKICSLATIDALTGSAIANGTGYIYVPKVLLPAYQAATNWSTYSAQFRAIEDYSDITGG